MKVSQGSTQQIIKSKVRMDRMQYLDQVRLDYHKQLVYNLFMIRTFADTETERFYITGKSRRFPPDVLKRAVKRLTQIDAATVIDDLRMPPSNRLESLIGVRAGQWSLRINEQWRVCFRFENGEAYDVEIVDYH